MTVKASCPDVAALNWCVKVSCESPKRPDVQGTAINKFTRHHRVGGLIVPREGRRRGDVSLFGAASGIAAIMVAGAAEGGLTHG